MKHRAPRKVEPPHLPLAPNLHQVVHNLLVTKDGRVLAGYRIGPARWDFTSLAAKQVALNHIQDGWAALVTDSRFVQERVTTKPHPVAEWAARLDERTQHPVPDIHTCDGTMSRSELLDGRCGCETWNKHLLRMQRVIARSGMDDKVVFRYLAVGKIDPKIDIRAHALALQRHGTRPPEEVRAIFQTEKRTKDVVTTFPNWQGRRMTEREQQWLRARSLGIGIPAPFLRQGDVGGWDTGDIPALSNDTRWLQDQWDRTTRVIGFRDGRKIERRVQVLTCSRLSDFNYPNNDNLDPWQAYAERVIDASGHAVPVEWNLVGRLMSGEELTGTADLESKTAKNMAEGYLHFKEEPPESGKRSIQRAGEVYDQVSNGTARESSRFFGTINAIVYGEDQYDEDGKMIKTAEEHCWERGEAVIRVYGGNAMGMEFTVPFGQPYKLMEAVAGEPYDTEGFQRRVPLDYLAAGMPNVSASVGDGHGPYLGYTIGSARRPVQHDPHYATQGRGHLGRGTNMFPIVSTLGGGKSTLGGGLGYNEVRRSHKSIIVDPSGPLAALCYMPEIAAVSLDMNLLKSEDGILSPPALILDPVHEPGEAHEVLVRQARQQRSNLTQDAALRCLGDDLYTHASTRRSLREAARRVEWTADKSMFDLIDALRDLGDDHSLDLAGSLQDASETPLLSLLFAPRRNGGDFSGAQHQNKVLTVISTPGIKRAPDNVDRRDWNPEELAANPVTHLAMLYATRELYGKTMGDPAFAFFDEAEFMTDGGTGRALLMRLFRDHSKWNMALYLGLKDLSDEFLASARNFVGGAFIGQITNEVTARKMLSILNVDDPAYAKQLVSLGTHSPGEFVHLDVNGRVGKIKVDVDYFPHLRQTLLTTPSNHSADAWALSETV